MNRKKIGEIFELKRGQISSLPYRPYRDGVAGDSLEAALQGLIEENPEIVPGAQIDPGVDDPPTFATLSREVSIGGQSLDLLLVDQRGVLTLIECKLVENSESRRRVIGQILDYAANAADAWEGGRLREEASRYWSQKGLDLDDVLDGLMKGELDAEHCWQQVKENLKQRRLRLIIATDRLRPEVRKVIELLNADLHTIEMLGLEIRCYGAGEDSLILVPKIIGQTQATARKTSSKIQFWNEKRLKEYYATLEPTLGQRLVALLDCAKGAKALIESRTQNPIFGIEGRHGQRIITMMRDGGVYCFMSPTRYGDSEAERDAFIEELNTLSVFAYDPSNVKEGKSSDGTVDQLTDDEFADFLSILKRYCSTD